MKSKAQPIVWVLANRKWLAAVAIAGSLGIVVGIGAAQIDGKYAILQIVGSMVGAALGVVGGVIGGLMIQEQRRRDDLSPEVGRLISGCEQIIPWLEAYRATREHPIEFEELVFAELNFSLRDTELFAPAPKLGLSIGRLLMKAKDEARMWTSIYAMQQEDKQIDRTPGLRMIATRLEAVIVPLASRLKTLSPND